MNNIIGQDIFKNDLPMESDGSFFQCNIIEELWIEYILDQTLDPLQLLVPLHSYMYTQLYLSLSPSQSIHPYLYIYLYIQYIIFDSHLLAIFPLYSCCWWTPIPPHILSYTPYTYEYNQYVYYIYIYVSNSYIYIYIILEMNYTPSYTYEISPPPHLQDELWVIWMYHRSKMGTVYIPGHCVTEALQSLSLPEECRLARRWSRLSISNGC